MNEHAFQSVLAAARANAEWAWQQVYDEHAPRVLQYLRVQRVADAEDLLGEVFLRVVRGIHSFEGDEDGFRGWLYTIATNVVRDAARRSARSAAVQDALAAGEVADQSAAAGDSGLYDLLGLLPPDQRAVVFLRVIADLPVADVAVALGRSEAAIKMVQQRALRTLRESRYLSDPPRVDPGV